MMKLFTIVDHGNEIKHNYLAVQRDGDLIGIHASDNNCIVDVVHLSPREAVELIHALSGIVAAIMSDEQE
jgi:hypothetical protein